MAFSKLHHAAEILLVHTVEFAFFQRGKSCIVPAVAVRPELASETRIDLCLSQTAVSQRNSDF